jgi:hypothetical protein
MFTSVPEVSTSVPNTVDEKRKDTDKENEEKVYTNEFRKIDGTGIRLCPYRLFCKNNRFSANNSSMPDS